MPYRWIAALAAGLVPGAGLGWWARGSPPPVSQATAEPTVATPTPQRATSSAWAPPADLESCAQELQVARAILDAAERERVGVPVPFPPDLPTAYTPAGFERAVKQALAACPDAPVELAHVDCTEFPCMAFFTQPAGSMNHAVESLRGCPGWSSTFVDADYGQANSNFMTDEGPAEWSLLAPTPPGTPSDENRTKRWGFRMVEGDETLMDEQQGRPFTEAESLDASITFFEEQGGPQAEAMLPMLRAKRAALDEP